MDNIEDFKSYKINKDVIEAAKLKQTEKLTFTVPPVKAVDEDYNPEELDVLALWCTLVKVMFAVGALDILPEIIALISKSNKSAKRLDHRIKFFSLFF
jgi:hypothetical protein